VSSALRACGHPAKKNVGEKGRTLGFASRPGNRASLRSARMPETLQQRKQVRNAFGRE
jgi:hypothetical protein